MSMNTDQLTKKSQKSVKALKANTLAAIVMLLIELGLGIGVNLYSKLPIADKDRSIFAAFARAVSDGPVILALHAVLGTLLLASAVSLVVRAVSIRRPILTWFATFGLVAILAAWISGARFVGAMANSESLSMCLATCVSLLCYSLILFTMATA
jgi:hypothetical protein